MIYLDNAATSFPKAPGVKEAVSQAITSPLGNAGRSSHWAGRQADKILFETRELLARLFGVADSSRFIFTSNTTQALNLVIKGCSGRGEGPVLVSSMEHNSVMRPLRYLEEHSQWKIALFRSTEESGGYPDLIDYEEKIKRLRPRMVVTTGASNVSGVIFPVKELCRIARENGVPICIDGAQLVGETEINLTEWGPDFFCFAGHKGLLGPTGTGGLYIGSSFSLDPLIFGGTGSRSTEEYQPDFLPDKYESGTHNLVGLAGLHASLTFLLKEGIEGFVQKREALCCRFIDAITERGELKIVGNRSKYLSTSIVSLYYGESSGDLKERKEKDLAEVVFTLDKAGIAVRLGYHCAPAAHKSLNTFSGGGTIRVSPGCFTTKEEINRVVSILSC